MNAESWRDEALCAEIGTEMWFPEKGGNAQPAKRICAACRVRFRCLEYAVDNDIPHGIWGGLTRHERLRAIRKRAA